ncbi:MAG: hypothetical protein A2X94_15450 [Bdellovibrionales bacterium GWB1_55_8]|nr:MAG: hypothetical protein A2X94_15450 [Bdellovibrionales bacterium GWB1_55_8]
MALKVHFASLSFGASVDQQTGSLSIFDIVEELRTPQVPMHLQALVITLAMEKTEPGDFNGKVLIHILTPDGKQQMVGTGEMRVPAQQRRLKAVFRFGGFPVLAFGDHRFVVSLMNDKGSKVGESLLDFNVVQATQVAQGVSPSEKPPVSH